MAKAKFESTPAARWTDQLAARGYTPVVRAFVELACRRAGRKGGGLGLSPTQAMLIIQLISYKRDIRMPFPAIKTLAARLGVSDTTVRNNLDALARKKLIVKHLHRGFPTYYDLQPLFKQLENLQVAAEARKDQEEAEEASRRFPEYYADETSAEAKQASSCETGPPSTQP